MSVNGTAALVITNPLVKYRALLATKCLNPDPAQHRLAIHLQGLYERLKDYEPQIEYSRRLDEITRIVNRQTRTSDASKTSPSRVSWRSLLSSRDRRGSLALIRKLTSQESALQLNTPKGLLLHGEVGTGKSMLVDLFAECLPTRKKRRWHFNNFMLETFAKLESLRHERLNESSGRSDDYSMLHLARDMIENSPILFLDEFQLPDRAASKIMSNLMTSFFHLGGVLIATSNRMPEELAKAAGIEFSPAPSSWESLGRQFGFGKGSQATKDKLFAGQNEFAGFLDVLKARCEVWEMESEKDYRRMESGTSRSYNTSSTDHPPGIETDQSFEQADSSVENVADASSALPSYPRYYTVTAIAESSDNNDALGEALGLAVSDLRDFPPSTLRVYGRVVSVPKSSEGVSCWTFEELCKSSLGPADYISIASAFHTLILTEVPVLTWLMKNEARRFITLLDALYECRCKLFVTAEAGPDDIFFPDKENDESDDAVHSETFSEAYQDATAPFRPNILTQNPNYAEPDSEPDYTHARLQGLLNADALEDDPPNKPHRNAFARSFGRVDSEMERRPVDPDELRYGRPNFSKTSAFTGEDERFAYKRAQSRLWEMCSIKWWSRDEPDWHRPVPIEVRRWERSMMPFEGIESRTAQATSPNDVMMGESTNDETRDERSFKQPSSPFRTMEEPPPKFSWTHIWGTVKWGPKAGAWGQGVDGLKDRDSKKR